MHRRNFLLTALAAVPTALASCSAAADARADQGHASAGTFEVTRTEAEWRKILTTDQFRVLREQHTERPGSSSLNAEKRRGTYHCAGCDLPLYSSATKFESGTGWPSFTAPLDNAVGTSVDRSLFGVRIEVHCRRCGGHQGHVFDDGPRPTGKRYCMNGVAMTFKPAV
jgi:peptide-methionine (R)-S-oxide reductase